MKTLFLFLLTLAFGLEVLAGERGQWQVDVFQRTSTNHLLKVKAFLYEASILSSGEVFELTPGIFFLDPIENTNQKIHGRLIVGAKKITQALGILRLEVWDTSGLDGNSPLSKSYFMTDQNLSVGEKTQIEFTQGDASHRGGFVSYYAEVQLLKLRTCKDDGDCKNP